ncbi:RusA family crossover junction endodeoxyribonuclease [Burkholderia gladioli]|uniref:RusA family crossover junction endodeoxyribonuclease n=1 Tax=Burkholderia gladioli TaxID=28095 RepID=UPI00163F1C0A|nr:RusA family crossover junction endodeoxyribonuclease [Burkholderia gladioli]
MTDQTSTRARAHLTVKLPYPISANRYWRPVNVGKHITIVPTKEAKAFKAEVGFLLKAAGVREPFPHRVHIHIDLYPHRPQDWQTRQRKLGATWDDTVQCIDIDNARKVLYDAFKGVAIVDDKWIWSDSATRREPDGEARVVVTITPIVVAQPQAALELA